MKHLVCATLILIVFFVGSSLAQAATDSTAIVEITPSLIGMDLPDAKAELRKLKLVYKHGSGPEQPGTTIPFPPLCYVMDTQPRVTNYHGLKATLHPGDIVIVNTIAIPSGDPHPKSKSRFTPGANVPDSCPGPNT